MKKGILIYKAEDAKVNEWFISHLTEKIKKNNIQLDLFIEDGKTEIPENIDFCINRSRNSSVNEALEMKGVRCFNNKQTVEIANDKWLTYLLCKEEKISVMETEKADNFSTCKFPAVVKSRNGHGGSEVFMLNSEEDLVKMDFSNPFGYIFQKPCSCIGVDVRIYVLGTEIITAVKRSSDTDFRSNFKLGGNVELFTPDDEQLLIIEKLQKKLNTDYVGFDFIMHNGHWVLNEIEDAVGARMLYQLCDIDIIEKFADYITERIDKKC